MHRSRDEWLLFGRAFVLVVFVRVALWALPFRAVRRYVQRLRRAERRPRPDEGYALRAAWAVRAAARRVPAASCLTQALACHTLLGKAGIDSEIRIGVTRDADGTFKAHAWVIQDGRTILGRLPDLHRYLPLPSLDGLDAAPRGL